MSVDCFQCAFKDLPIGSDACGSCRKGLLRVADISDHDTTGAFTNITLAQMLKPKTDLAPEWQEYVTMTASRMRYFQSYIGENRDPFWVMRHLAVMLTHSWVECDKRCASCPFGICPTMSLGMAFHHRYPHRDGYIRLKCDCVNISRFGKIVREFKITPESIELVDISDAIMDGSILGE